MTNYTTKWDKEYKSQIRPEGVPAETLWFHSTGFVRGWAAVKNADKIISAVDCGKSDFEICCTTVKKAHWVKSQIGLLVKGEVTLLADTDVFSWVDPQDGIRYVERSYDRCIYRSYEDFLKETNNTGGYPEVFVKTKEIVAVVFADTNFRKWHRKYGKNFEVLSWEDFEAQYRH